MYCDAWARKHSLTRLLRSQSLDWHDVQRGMEAKEHSPAAKRKVQHGGISESWNGRINVLSVLFLLHLVSISSSLSVVYSTLFSFSHLPAFPPFPPFPAILLPLPSLMSLLHFLHCSLTLHLDVSPPRPHCCQTHQSNLKNFTSSISQLSPVISLWISSIHGSHTNTLWTFGTARMSLFHAPERGRTTPRASESSFSIH